jgi:membrane protein implicated in regulation of membrane protease activity
MSVLSTLTGFGLPMLWSALAVILLIVEILLLPVGFFISFAGAALILALKAAIFGTWTDFLDEALFAGIGVILILPARRLLNLADKTPNINDY